MSLSQLTQNGVPALKYNDYVFIKDDTKHTAFDDDTITRWVCEKTQCGCKAAIFVFVRDNTLIIERQTGIQGILI
jgi:hypothetical protein